MRMSIFPLVFILIFGCSSKDMETAKNELLKTDSLYSEYAEKYGVDSAFTLFSAEEPLLLPMNELPIKGRKGIKEHLPSLKDGEIFWEPESAEVSSALDIGYTWGNYTFKFTDDEGKTHRRYGKYVTLWKNFDGEWKWILDIGNRNPQFIELEKFSPDRDPFEDLQDAIDYASETNKRIILDVGGEWCIWCHRIDAFMHNTKEIKKLLDKYFVVVKINYSKENKNEEFLSNYPEIHGYPHFFVLESDGTLLHSQDTGKLEEGKGYSKEKFLLFLKRWSKS